LAKDYCNGILVTLPTCEIVHPNCKEIFVSFTEVEGGVKVVNNSERNVGYLARDPETFAWTSGQTMKPGDTHLLKTTHSCSFFFEN